MTSPNILLITTDQQRHDTCGPNSPSFMRTPHYDMLANEGVQFTRAYSDCPICVAARTTIMTGKFATRHGMLNNGSTSSVMGRKGTLPSLLSQAGYQTCAIGKMHFGPQRVRHGFEEMIILEDYYRELERSASLLKPMRTGLNQIELYPGMATVPEALTLTAWTAQKCVNYIRERRDPTVPFFLWCSFAKPHPPLDPPEPYYSMYQNSDLPEPVTAKWSEPGSAPVPFERSRQTMSSDRYTPETIRAARAAYYGLVTQVDYNLGRVLAALTDVGLYDDTLILYTSDHGEALGDHGASGKVFPYDYSARIPFVLRPPRSWDVPYRGRLREDLITLADILPTLVGVAAGESGDQMLPPQIDGRSLWPLLDGKVSALRETVAMTCCSNETLAPGQEGMVPAYQAITDGRWKYIWYAEGAHEQLFQLEKDPGELYDLSTETECRKELDRLKEALMRELSSRHSPWVREGKLLSYPAAEDTELERRARLTPTFTTEWTPYGGRH